MDYSGKYRPVLERIASLNGRSIGVNVMSGGGGVPSLTDQDIAGAVAMTRQYQAKAGKRDAPPLQTCARPELLLLKWGERVDLIPLIAKRCSDALLSNRRKHQTERDERDNARMVRSASLLAAQGLAGRQMDLEVSTWALVCPVLELQREIGYALAWMQGELSEAERGYCHALRRWVEGEREAA